MILQALTQYYEVLAKKGKIDRPGWGVAPVSVALYIDENGRLEQAVSIKTEVVRGKKKAMRPQQITVPMPAKRTSGVLPNFLCDNSRYILGFDDGKNNRRALECFEACKAFHEQLLADVDREEARAVLAFFRSWNPQQAGECPELQEVMEDLLQGSNIVFRYWGSYVHEVPEIAEAWQRHYDADADGPQMVCLVTGQKGPVEAVHPAIKKVWGAQSSGAALVSFNAPSLCSYGKEQSLNAPTGKYAAFAYAAALNHLLADEKHVNRTSDSTVIYWAKSAEKEYQDLGGWAFFDSAAEKDAYNQNDLMSILRAISRGEKVRYEEKLLDPDMDFYILGLSPNAARLSVRFFYRNTFGAFVKNVLEHYERMEIVRPPRNQLDALPVWKILNETVNQNARDKSPVPNLAGETLRAILNNTRYPATLLNGVTLRIRAEHEINWIRAGMIKAYYLKNPHTDVPKEVLTVALNSNSTNIPYTLGRIFSVLEAIQLRANPGINTTIRDRYFNSASATPAYVFPTLLNLAQKHLKKMDDGMSIYFQKQLTELLAKLEETYPQHLNLPQQGAFQLGYYHQTQARYQKKEEAKDE